MRKTVGMPLVPLLVAAILLLAAYNISLPAREARIQEELTAKMQTILPGSTEFVVEPYAGEDANIKSVHKGENGFVIETVTRGYADDIRMMVGVSNKGTVTGLVVLDMAETFGLGAEALSDHVFLAQMLNTSGEAEVGENVDAITGATVTSKAVVRSVNSAVAFVTGADTESGATSWGG